MVALRTVYRWELRKLVAQKRTYLGLGAAVAVPIIFVVALALQSGQPNDVAFGRYVRQSGLAIPPVILIFGSTGSSRSSPRSWPATSWPPRTTTAR